MLIIKQYSKTDYPLIKGWWLQANEWPPTEDMIPEDSSFIAFENDIPMAVVSLYLTNSPAVCYVENLIGNPEFKKERKHAISSLQEFIQIFAKKLGYKNLLCFSSKEKLKERYKSLGYSKTKDNLTSFIREL